MVHPDVVSFQLILKSKDEDDEAMLFFQICV